MVATYGLLGIALVHVNIRHAIYTLMSRSNLTCRFNSPLGFEPTPEVAIFDLLGITLVHGWLVDPEDAETAEALGTRSYNEVLHNRQFLQSAQIRELQTGETNS